MHAVEVRFAPDECSPTVVNIPRLNRHVFGGGVGRRYRNSSGGARGGSGDGGGGGCGGCGGGANVRIQIDESAA
jgi:hypothetical protein